MTKLIFGCGYLGSHVARAWRDAGEEVYVVTRRAERASSLIDEGFRPLVGDVTQPDTLAPLPVAETVLFAVGFDRSSGSTIEQVYAGGLQSVLDALPSGTGRVIYISSTGVYSQSDGSWVDEESPCEPTRPGGRACLAAEQRLAAHRSGEGGVVLRLAGIYGPGRLPLVEKLRSGEPLPAAADVYLNLIHVEDAARVVVVADRAATLSPRYCVSDGHPTLRREFYAHLATRIAAPAPKFGAPRPGGPSAQRATTNKRVSNRRLIEELGVTLAYPSFREGLAAMVGQP